VDVIEPKVREELEAMRAQYEARPYAELANLGWIDLAPLTIQEEVYRPSIWSEDYNGKLLIVVQLQRNLWLGWKRTACIGSILSQDGEIEHVDEFFLMNEIGHP
jgi:hypothetical protein